MNEHVNDLSDFLTRDQKGKMLLDYQLKLAEVVTAEQQGIIEELGQLAKGIIGTTLARAPYRKTLNACAKLHMAGDLQSAGRLLQPDQAVGPGCRQVQVEYWW